MREIVSPLSGIRSPFGQLTSPLAIYAVLGVKPQLVFDFANGRFFTMSSRTTFDNAITHSRSSNATMVDSDGLLKWAPHNLVRYSEDFSNAAWADGAISGGSRVNGALSVSTSEGYAYIQQLVSTAVNVSHIIEVDVTCDTAVTAVPLRAGMGTSTASSLIDFAAGETKRVSFSVTPSSGTLTIGLDARNAVVPGGSNETGYVITLDRASVYRSDLGGMVDNPDRGDSYVPTTSSARYLARRGHHIYNGSAWVNEGMLHESEARTNLLTYSDDFASWVSSNSPTVTANAATSPDGSTNATALLANGTGGFQQITLLPTLADSTDYCFSVYFKAAVGNSGVRLALTGKDGITRYFGALSDGSLSTPVGATNVIINTLGNNWYRLSGVLNSYSGATTSTVRIYMTDSTGGINTMVSGDGIYIYGAQFEAGSTPSSCIPTSGATVTRAADTLTVPSANLPWPTPNVIGPELVTNGAFDTDLTGWTQTGTVYSQSGGALVVNASLGSGTDLFLDQAFTDEVGKVYRVAFDVVSRVAGQIDVRLRGGTAVTHAAVSAAGSYSFVLVGNGTNNKLTIAANTVADLVLDNISVREIDPLAVSIQMQGRMTYADTGSTVEADFVAWQADSNNRINVRLYTSGAYSGALYAFQISSGTFDDVIEVAPGSYSPGINVPFNIASRHGSTFINGAVDGTALTANTTPTALPDLSSTDLQLGYDYMGCIKLLRIWAADLADAGIATASAPSLEPSLLLTFDGSEGSFTVSDWSE